MACPSAQVSEGSPRSCDHANADTLSAYIFLQLNRHSQHTMNTDFYNRRAKTLTSTWCLLGTFRALQGSGEPRRVTTGSIFREEEGTTMGCNKFWGKFSCEAIRALPTFRPGSNRIANLLSNRIGAHRYLPRRRYGKLNILGQYIRRAS